MINRINNNLYLYLTRVEQKPLYLRPVSIGIPSFKSHHIVTLGKIPDDIDIKDLFSTKQVNHNLEAVYDAKYCSKIYKYKSPKSSKTYAIKQLRRNGLRDDRMISLTKQLELEARAHKELNDINAKVPKFHYYQGDFSNSQGSERNNFIIMDWIDGETASNDGTYYDFHLMTNENIDEIYKQIFLFDKSGILHNDLWAANILFNKDGINIFDFNRIERYDPSRELLKSNLDSFKERFLLRYLSDVYQNYSDNKSISEQKLYDVYKRSIQNELELMNQKRRIYHNVPNGSVLNKFFAIKHHLEKQIDNPEILKKAAVQTIYDSDMRCSRIYCQYFEFENNEAIETLNRARNVIKRNINSLDKDESKLIDSNLEIISKFKQTEKNLKQGNLNENLKVFEDIRLKLLDESIYGNEETNQFYYERFLSFTCLNIEILKFLINGDITKAEQFYKTKPKSLKECRRLDEYFTQLEKEISKNN